MIIIKNQRGEEHIVKPTIFPDKTSQVWNLTDESLRSKHVIWYFEEEREIFDVGSLLKLLGAYFKFEGPITLEIPYFPFARQDKPIKNNNSFNLYIFMDLLSKFGFDFLKTYDVHNERPLKIKFGSCFENISVSEIHKKLIEEINPDLVVFPDQGAEDRYSYIKDFQINNQKIFTASCEKIRDQDGNIISHTLFLKDPSFPLVSMRDEVLIIDDICDGGATFISVSKIIRSIHPACNIHLFVTHGLFSKGRQHLLDNGIDHIYTTNSLIKNKEDFKL